MKQAHIVVSGRVQGVFFRTTTKDKARQLGLKGYVKNLGNGDVEVVAQGDENSLRELIQFCQKGPSGAEVGGIDVQYKYSKETFYGFDIRF